MDFNFTNEQEQLREATIAFGKAELANLSKKDCRQSWAKCVAFGILGLPFPIEYGGLGQGPIAATLALEALGSVCCDNGLLFALGAQLWSVQMPIFRFGSESQKKNYLPALCAGEITGGHAMSEPESGSDAFSLRTTAVRDGSDYILNGSKTFVTNAELADVFVVFASTDSTRSLFGITAFLVDRQQPGLTVGKPLEKMGLESASLADVYLADCRVKETNRLGQEGQGAHIFRDSLEWERGLILAGQVGSMKRQLDATIEYAKMRRQFGKPIGKFQAVSHKIADMKARLEASRLLLYKTAWQKETGCKTEAASAVTKLFISEAAVASAIDAIQIHGGYGYMTDSQIEVNLRDAIGSKLFSGTSEIMRNIIANDLQL